MMMGNGSLNLNYPVYFFTGENIGHVINCLCFQWCLGFLCINHCALYHYDSPYKHSLQGRANCMTVLVSRTCNVLGTPAASYCHGAQEKDYFLRYFKDLYSVKYIMNMTIFLPITSECPPVNVYPLPSFIQYIQ